MMNQTLAFISEMRQEKRSFLSEHESKNILASYNIPSAKEILITTKDDIKAALEKIKISFPIVMKVDTPDIQHKTEAGLVRLNVLDLKMASEVYDELISNAAEYSKEARLNGVLLQEMVSGAVAECIVGVSKDSQFGPVILFGLGGIMVEVFEDVSLRIPPFDKRQAKEMIEEIKGHKLLTGFRGKPPADINAIVEVLVGMSKLAMELKNEIQEIDLNPILVFPEGEGVKAVDALIRLRDIG